MEAKSKNCRVKIAIQPSGKRCYLGFHMFTWKDSLVLIHLQNLKEIRFAIPLQFSVFLNIFDLKCDQINK